MKKIVLACGSGVATSTAVAKKVSEFLDENGLQGTYHIVQCAIAEASTQCQDADLLIATTIAPAGIECAYVNGVAFLTGIGLEDTKKKILAYISGS